MNESAVKVAVHRLRKRYRELIRDEIAFPTGTDAKPRFTPPKSPKSNSSARAAWAPSIKPARRNWTASSP
jgi:hypothetical protein